MTGRGGSRTIEDQLATIRDAYDRTVEDYRAGLREEDLLPEDFRASPAYQRFLRARHACNSGEPDIRDFLAPAPGLCHLDVGSGVNLIGYGLFRWPSRYFGTDISSRLTAAARGFALRNSISVGGLVVAEASRIPFRAGFFDILSAIGVLEYYDLRYIASALGEFRRILKGGGRAVVDMPNPVHPDTEVMIDLESRLGRPRFNLPSRGAFESEMAKHFAVQRIDDSQLMIKYFLRAKES